MSTATYPAILDHDQELAVADLQTPEINNLLYGAVLPDDPAVLTLADSIKAQGILEPLIVSQDGFVISGNRRLCAARLLGLLTVPVRVEEIHSDNPAFDVLVVEHNRQRVKSPDTLIREEALLIDPSTAHRRLVDARRQIATVKAAPLVLGDRRDRSAIKGNRPLADAVIRIVEDRAEDGPLSDRQIHYLLLNDPPLLHARKATRYGNNPESYRTLTNILTRLRVFGEIPFQAIADATRPVTEWSTHRDVQFYMRDRFGHFLTDYWRDLQQNQPNHIELLVEKLTVADTLRPLASEFTIPFTVGRGFSSIPPRFGMVDRWRRSGKDKLVVVIASDLDPAGETIAESFGRSLRDDFGVPQDDLVVVKAALTKTQADELQLPPAMEAKMKASTAAEYVRRYGPHVWELEAVPPDTLRNIVREQLLAVMDLERLHYEQQREVEESRVLQAYREAVLRFFQNGGTTP